MALLDDLIKRFSETTKVFPSSQLLESAIAKAHADMSRRAKGHKSEFQVESIKWLKKRFTTVSPFTIKNQLDFDEWHHETCEEYCKHMNAYIHSQGFDFSMTYGRAQKVLNMTFKYLYCTSTYKADVEKIVPYLHMALDGYTLRWYKEMVVKYINYNRPKGVAKLKVGDISDWSKMNESGKHQYSDIQKGIREYLKKETYYKYFIDTERIDEEFSDEDKTRNNTISVEIPFDATRKYPFFAEFIVWQGEIVRAKIDNLLKGLNSLYKTFADDKWATNNDIVKELKAKIATLLKSV